MCGSSGGGHGLPQVKPEWGLGLCILCKHQKVFSLWGRLLEPCVGEQGEQGGRCSVAREWTRAGLGGLVAELLSGRGEPWDRAAQWPGVSPGPGAPPLLQLVASVPGELGPARGQQIAERLALGSASCGGWSAWAVFTRVRRGKRMVKLHLIWKHESQLLVPQSLESAGSIVCK